MNSKINIAVLSDYPFSMNFGGKEIQMLQYKKNINERFSDIMHIKLLNYWDFNDLADVDILHFFGYANWYHDISKFIKTKYPNIKFVVSPTYYVKKPILFKNLSFLFRNFKIPNYFSYKNKFFHLTDSIICNSHSEVDEITKIFPSTKKQKIFILANGIEQNLHIFNDESNKHMFLEKYNIEPNYLLCVSFLDERKNTINLIDSFLKIEKNINRKLVLIGKNRYLDPIKFKYVEKLILINSDKILHIPYLERESDIFKSAYYNSFAHILPSHMETPGISTIEAGAFKKPIIVGACPPVKEYFGGYATFINSKSNKSISEGIMKVYNMPIGEIREKTEGFYHRIQELYTIEFLVNDLVEIYKKTVS